MSTDHESVVEEPTSRATPRSYSLTGPEAERARARGFVDGSWFRAPIDPERLRQLTERTTARAVVDLVLWLALIVALGVAAVMSLGNWWAIPLFMAYGALAVGASDARWHEFGHGTASNSERLNDAVYVFASFMLWRNPTAWRWSHFRHHSDTIIVGRDPEIQLTRPPRMWRFFLNYTYLDTGVRSLAALGRYATGRIDPETCDYVPESERHRVVRESRAFLAVLAGVVVLAIAIGSVVPLLLVGLSTFYGAWLMVFFGATQHLGLREDVLDHRYTTRSVRMNPVFRFLYLNMNYHIEHHMYPAVPYHQLPALHREVADSLPPPSPSMGAAYREIIGALWRQRADENFEVERSIPTVPPAELDAPRLGFTRPDGSADLGPLDLIEVGTVSRVDVGTGTFAVARVDSDRVIVIDGRCTHGNAHLGDGAIVTTADGPCIECPKHNGRFDLATGSPCRKPVTVAVDVHSISLDAGHIIVAPPTEELTT